MTSDRTMEKMIMGQSFSSPWCAPDYPILLPWPNVHLHCRLPMSSKRCRNRPLHPKTKASHSPSRSSPPPLTSHPPQPQPSTPPHLTSPVTITGVPQAQSLHGMPLLTARHNNLRRNLSYLLPHLSRKLSALAVTSPQPSLRHRHTSTPTLNSPRSRHGPRERTRCPRA